MNLPLLFLLGAGLGSAANAVIYRWPLGVSWIRGRSFCPRCRHKLNWYDLIPIGSYLLLWGKCRYCHSPIPLRYLVVELIMAAGAAGVASSQLSVISALVLIGILWLTVIIAFMDWETRLVSEAMVAGWAVLVISYQLSAGQLSLISSLVGLVVGAGLIGGIWAGSRGKAMGFGDVEIAAVVGWWLGWPQILPGLWTAFVAGAGVGLALLVSHQARLKSQIAFGPFLVAGAWMGFLWGDKMMRLVYGS